MSKLWLKGLSPLFLVLLLVVGTSGAFAQPQVPYVPPDTLDERRRVSQTDIRFCVWTDNPLLEFETRIATEIAHALLLEPIVTEIDMGAVTNDADFWQTMYTALTNQCEALMGYILVPEQLPVWMIASRPYFSSGTILAVLDPNINALTDVPRGSFVGSLLSTFGDFQFINYLRTLPDDRSWRRLPFDSPDKLFERLLDGTLSGALVPEVALYGASQSDSRAQQIIAVPSSPLSIAPTQFSIGLRSSETSLRTMIDEAILALVQDGTIERIMGELALPGKAGTPGR